MCNANRSTHNLKTTPRHSWSSSAHKRTSTIDHKHDTPTHSLTCSATHKKNISFYLQSHPLHQPHKAQSTVDLLELVQRLALLQHQQQQQHQHNQWRTSAQAPIIRSNNNQYNAPRHIDTNDHDNDHDDDHIDNLSKDCGNGDVVEATQQTAAAPPGAVNGLRQLPAVIATTPRRGRQRTQRQAEHPDTGRQQHRHHCDRGACAPGYGNDGDDDQYDERTAIIMGSNVSRHSGKGLSGRRTQSSGKCV